MRITRYLLWAAGLSLVVCAPHAHADTITTFNVSGSATNITAGSLGSCGPGATCAFSGTLRIDVTSGAVNAPLGTASPENVDITFPGLASFTTLVFTSPLNPFDGPNWETDIDNSVGDRLGLHFDTMKTPASLVGFTGGSISGVSVDAGETMLYKVSSGSITPASTATPEPSSLALTLLGLGAWLWPTKRPTSHSRPA